MSSVVRERRRIALIGAVAAAVAANVYLPRLLGGASGRNGIYLAAFALGCLVSQACLLAIWAALGSQSVLQRLPLTLVLLTLLTCAYAVGLQIGGELPLEVAFITFTAAAALFCSVKLPLLLARWLTGCRIDSFDAQPLKAVDESAQFGVRYLLGCVAGVAVLLVLIRNSLPQSEFSQSIRQRVPEIVAMVCLFVLLSALICLPCVRIVLGRKLVAWPLVRLIAVMLFGPATIIALMSWLFSRPPPPSEVREILLSFHLFTAGHAGILMLALLAMRACGLRLTRRGEDSARQLRDHGLSPTR